MTAKNSITLPYRKFYFIGLAGSGMSSIAHVLLSLGYEVSGWDDACDTDVRALLEKDGARFVRWDAVDDAECLVYSTAIPAQHEVFAWAKEHKLAMFHRSDILALLTHIIPTIAVCGSHGKTTTTSMVHHILTELKVRHATILGGILNGQLGGHIDERPEFLVIEACESDRTFLKYSAECVILTNISHDHLEYYDNSIDQLISCFAQWLNDIQPQLILPCGESTVDSVINQLTIPYRQVGLHSPDYTLQYVLNGLSSEITLTTGHHAPMTFSVPAPGDFNAMNAAMALALVHSMGFALEGHENILSSYKRVGRRFDYQQVEHGGNTIHWISDYGHHPHEIAVMIKTMRAIWPNLPIRMVFEPHRYTRLSAHFDAFCSVLSTVDALYVLPVYAASEAPIEGMTSDAIVEHIALSFHRVASASELQTLLVPWGQSSGVIVFQGAGTVHQHGMAWLREYHGL